MSKYGRGSIEVIEVASYMGWSHVVGFDPSNDWKDLMAVLSTLTRRDDVAWTLGSKGVVLHDHLDFDARNDDFPTADGPLVPMFELVLRYVRYKAQEAVNAYR